MPIATDIGIFLPSGTNPLQTADWNPKEELVGGSTNPFIHLKSTLVKLDHFPRDWGEN